MQAIRRSGAGPPAALRAERVVNVTLDGVPVTFEEIIGFQKNAEKYRMVKKVLKLVLLENKIQDEIGDFDSCQHTINLINGLINLDTGELAPHDPSHLVTKIVPVAWNANSECPAWVEFICPVANGDS